MPGFNQRGPMNEGPMTGRQMGRCATASDRSATNTDPAWGTPGYGRGGFIGGRRCRGFRWRASMTESVPVQDDSENIATTGKLLSHIQRLEMEIEALKDQVQQGSNS
jgi:hypothetical protein